MPDQTNSAMPYNIFHITKKCPAYIFWVTDWKHALLRIRTHSLFYCRRLQWHDLKLFDIDLFCIDGKNFVSIGEVLKKLCPTWCIRNSTNQCSRGVETQDFRIGVIFEQVIVHSVTSNNRRWSRIYTLNYFAGILTIFGIFCRNSHSRALRKYTFRRNFCQSDISLFYISKKLTKHKLTKVAGYQFFIFLNKRMCRFCLVAEIKTECVVTSISWNDFPGN